MIAETVPAEKRAQSFLQVGIVHWLKDACGAFSIHWLKDACGAFSIHRLKDGTALSAFIGWRLVRRFQLCEEHGATDRCDMYQPPVEVSLDKY